MNTLLQLTRPLVWLDFETTGTIVEIDRIIQMAMTVHYPLGYLNDAGGQKETVRWTTLVNPGEPIPSEASAVHGILDEHVKDAPMFKQYAAGLATKLSGVDFGGQNVTFDLKMLRAEMKRLGIAWDWEESDAAVIDTGRIHQIKNPRKLSDLYREYLGKEMEDAHDAGADIAATEEVFVAQLARYEDLPRTVKELGAFCYPDDPSRFDKQGKIIWRNGEACLNVGDWKGVPLRKVEDGMLKWILKKDFSTLVKQTIINARKGIYPIRNTDV